jgi:hypothetical protein
MKMTLEVFCRAVAQFNDARQRTRHGYRGGNLKNRTATSDAVSLRPMRRVADLDD